MKTAYTTMKGIEVMRALRKGQAAAFYCGNAWRRVSSFWNLNIIHIES